MAGGLMRVLMLHNRYQIAGGEDVSTDTQVELLRSAGHDVVLIEESNDRVETLGPIRTATRTVWSRESYHRIDDILERERFDVMHVQNFFPLLSPSVYYAAKQHALPVVQSLRNFRLLCPQGSLHREGRTCTDCVGRRVAWPGLQHACYRDSRAGTSVVAAMSSVHRATGTWRNRVALYVTPSQFAADMYIGAGWSPGLFEVIPNYVHPDPGQGSGKGGYALAVGRLESAKGTDVLLDAWRRLGINYPLKFAGDGPMRSLVETAAAEYPGIEYLGVVPRGQASTLMGEATFVIVPSTSTETFGRVAAEAMAKGTPAVVSDLGGLREIVDDGHTGWRVRAGDVSALGSKAQWMIEHPAEVAGMRQASRRSFLERFSAPRALDSWLSAYRRVSKQDE